MWITDLDMLYMAERGEKNTWLLTFSFESCENKDEIVVEVRKLVELFKFLAWQLRTSHLKLPK